MPLPKAFAHFNSPLYVPDNGRQVLKLLETGGPPQFLTELERLSALGSPWASAILGYMALMPGPDGKRDTGGAIELCRTHAHAGDPYAQFVYAWALIYSGQTKLAFESIKKATVSGFAPAALSFAAFIWKLPGNKASDAAAALKALGFAEKTGHKAAALWKCTFYKSGRLGFLRRPLGYLLWPVAAIRFIRSVRRDPFASRVFIFRSEATGPVIRDEPRLPFFQQWAKNIRLQHSTFQQSARDASAPARHIVMRSHAVIAFATLLTWFIALNLPTSAWRFSLFGPAVTVLLVLLPYAISAGHCWQMYTWQAGGPGRLRVALFVALLGASSALVNAVLLGVFGQVDGTLIFDLYALQVGAYLWGGDWILNVV